MRSINNKIFIFGFLLCILTFLVGLGYYLMQQTSDAQMQRTFDYLPESANWSTELNSTITIEISADFVLVEKGIDRRHFFGIFLAGTEDIIDGLYFMESKDGMFFEDAVKLSDTDIDLLGSLIYSSQMLSLIYNEEDKRFEAIFADPEKEDVICYTSEDGESWDSYPIALNSNRWQHSNILHVQGLGYFQFSNEKVGVVKMYRAEGLEDLNAAKPVEIEIELSPQQMAGQIRAIYHNSYYYLLIDNLPNGDLNASSSTLARSKDLQTWESFKDFDLIAKQELNGTGPMIGHTDMIAWQNNLVVYFTAYSKDYSQIEKKLVKLKLDELF